MSLSAVKETLLRLLLPEICAHCREDIPAGARGPLCARCLSLLVVDESEQSQGPIRSAFLYRGPALSLVHAFKFRGSKQAAALAGALMARGFSDPEAFDALVPVPLHPRREKERGYNQAEILAAELAKSSALPVVRPLERRRATKPSWSLSRQERRENLRGAFRARQKLGGGRFLLVDDVCTTGATFNSCAAELLAAGARSVRGTVFARQPY